MINYTQLCKSSRGAYAIVMVKIRKHKAVDKHPEAKMFLHNIKIDVFTKSLTKGANTIVLHKELIK